MIKDLRRSRWLTDVQLFSKILRATDARGLEAKKETEDTSKNQGRAQVMNLLTIDASAVASLGIYAWNVSNALINLLVGFWLLYSMLGISAVVGIGLIPLLSSLTTILAKFIYCKSRTETKCMCTDLRLRQVTGESS